NPFPRSQEVIDGLSRDKLFQPAAPMPGREEQIEAIRTKFKLPGSGMI
ncbi:MAG: hypothetical protein JRJ58_13650, partial [Deltaproteobacteria bacterium]|nr:hypothetical protein [Deltaproteobacteria bacterium]